MTKPNMSIIGKKFGSLTVLAPSEKRSAGHFCWEAECECGERIHVPRGALVTGNTKSCGCLKRRYPKDMTGMRFHMLTVKEKVRTGPQSHGWKCLCDCGEKVVVIAHDLYKGRYKSCGCGRTGPRGDWEGKRQGRLVFGEWGKRETSKGNSVTFHHAVCDCGKKLTVSLSSICSGQESCGCLRDEQQIVRQTKPDDIAARNRIIKGVQYSARSRNLELLLTNEEIWKLSARNCTYCGAEPANVAKSCTSTVLYNGIDRVDNSVGYILSNCVPCCSQCNVAKAGLSVDQFVSWIRRASAHLAGEQEANHARHHPHQRHDMDSPV